MSLASRGHRDRCKVYGSRSVRIYVSPIRVCDVDMLTVLWLRCSSDAIDLKDAIVDFIHLNALSRVICIQ